MIAAVTLDTAVCEDDFPFVWHGITFDDEGTGACVLVAVVAMAAKAL